MIFTLQYKALFCVFRQHLNAIYTKNTVILMYFSTKKNFKTEDEFICTLTNYQKNKKSSKKRRQTI
jgi:hypothetical protein